MDSTEDFDSWDPLTEDYHSKNRNTYNEGAGANLPSELQPANYRKNEKNLFKLWVRPISNRYTEDSLRNIFANYGEVVEAYIVTNTKSGNAPFGFVTFETQAAATDAIRGLNDNTNFDFKVSYANNRTPDNRVQNSNRNSGNRENNRPREFNNRDRNSRPNKSNAYDDWTDEGTMQTRNSNSIRSNSPLRNERSRRDTRDSQREPIRSNSPPNKDRIPTEPGRTANTEMKHAKEVETNGVSYSSPSQCQKCQKLTFLSCSSCGENFCNQECSLDAWRDHRGKRCVVVADLVRETSQTRESKSADYTLKFPPRGQLASEVESPGHEVSRFANLAKDYLECGRSSFDATSTKFNTVLDNNYEDNVDGGVTENKTFRERNFNRPESRKKYESGDDDHPKNVYDEGRNRRFDENEKPRNAYGDSRAKRFDNKENSDTDRSKYSDGNRDGHIGYNTKKSFDRRPREDRKSNDFEIDTNYAKKNAQGRIDKRYDKRANDDEPFTPKANSSAIDEIDVTPYVTGRLRLKIDNNSEVVIISLLNTDQKLCYVKMADEEDAISSMMKTLNEIKSFQPMEIVPKTKCVVKYRGTWYRALIENDAPQVKLIDYGKILSVRPDDIRAIPPSFSQIPPFAHSVKLPSVPSDQLVSWKDASEVVSIKPTAQEGRTWVAEVVVQPSFQEKLAQARKERDGVGGESPRRQKSSQDSPAAVPPQAVSSPKTPKREPQESDALLTAGVAKQVVVTWIKDAQVFFVADIQKFMDEFAKTSSLKFEQLKPLDDIKTGMLTMNLFSGICCRAKVLSTNPLEVSYIDYGNVEKCEAKDMRQLPPEFVSTPPLAVQVRLKEETVESNGISENEPITVTPILREKDLPYAWIVSVGDKSANFKEIHAKYTSSTEELSSSTVVEVVTTAEPKPPITLDLFITYGVSKSVYYAIRKTDAGVFESLNAKLSKPFEKAEEIVQGKVYAKNFEGLWCRAQVTNLTPLTVYFIDYGNEETCETEELHSLPEDLQKNPPPMAFKVVLKNPTQNQLEYSSWMNVSWDMDNDTYTLLRDPSTPAITPNSGVVSL